MDEKRSDFAWLEDLMKYWPAMVIIVGAIGWSTRMSFVQSAQASELSELNENVKSLKSIQAEWPYMKNKVDRIEQKTDQINEKLDRILTKSS